MRIGSSLSRSPWSTMKATSGSMRLGEQVYNPARNARTVQECWRRLRWKWASSPSRARGLAPRRSALLYRCGRGSGTPAGHATAPHVVRRGMSGRPSRGVATARKDKSEGGGSTEKCELQVTEKRKLRHGGMCTNDYFGDTQSVIETSAPLGGLCEFKWFTRG